MIVAAKRARQINNYHHQLGEGTFDDFAPPLVESRSKNYLTMALEEIAEGKINPCSSARSWLTRSVVGTMRPWPRPRRDRRDRGLQGVRARPAARQGRPRGDAAAHARRGALRPRRPSRRSRAPAGPDLYPHLDRADLLVIAPLSANTLAKLAHGLADNVLTEAALAHRGPVLVAPAMNVRMWEHPATQANVAPLRERGVELIGPDEGELAEGEWGRAAWASRRRSSPGRRSCEQCIDAKSAAGAACSSAPAGRESRSTRCASSATAPPGGWASRSPTRRAAAARA